MKKRRKHKVIMVTTGNQGPTLDGGDSEILQESLNPNNLLSSTVANYKYTPNLPDEEIDEQQIRTLPESPSLPTKESRNLSGTPSKKKKEEKASSKAYYSYITWKKMYQIKVKESNINNPTNTTTSNSEENINKYSPNTEVNSDTFMKMEKRIESLEKQCRKYQEIIQQMVNEKSEKDEQIESLQGLVLQNYGKKAKDLLKQGSGKSPTHHNHNHNSIRWTVQSPKNPTKTPTTPLLTKGRKLIFSLPETPNYTICTPPPNKEDPSVNSLPTQTTHSPKPQTYESLATKYSVGKYRKIIQNATQNYKYIYSRSMRQSPKFTPENTTSSECNSPIEGIQGSSFGGGGGGCGRHNRPTVSRNNSPGIYTEGNIYRGGEINGSFNNMGDINSTGIISGDNTNHPAPHSLKHSRAYDLQHRIHAYPNLNFQQETSCTTPINRPRDSENKYKNRDRDRDMDRDYNYNNTNKSENISNIGGIFPGFGHIPGTYQSEISKNLQKNIVKKRLGALSMNMNSNPNTTKRGGYVTPPDITDTEDTRENTNTKLLGINISPANANVQHIKLSQPVYISPPHTQQHKIGNGEGRLVVTAGCELPLPPRNVVHQGVNVSLDDVIYKEDEVVTPLLEKGEGGDLKFYREGDSSYNNCSKMMISITLKDEKHA